MIQNEKIKTDGIIVVLQKRHFQYTKNTQNHSRDLWTSLTQESYKGQPYSSAQEFIRWLLWDSHRIHHNVRWPSIE